MLLCISLKRCTRSQGSVLTGVLLHLSKRLDGKAAFSLHGVYRVDGSTSDFSEDFHVYSIDWNETAITWSVDGEQCAQHMPLQLMLLAHTDVL